MNLISTLAAIAVASVLAAMAISSEIRAFDSACRHLGATWLWSNARLETQLQSMERDEWETFHDRRLETLLSDSGESLLK